MEDQKELLNRILKERDLEARDYQIEFLTSPDHQFSERPFVLAGGTSSGKTEMTILKLEMFYSDPKNKNKRTLIIPASKTILLDNFADRISEFNPSFSYCTLTSKSNKLDGSIAKILAKDGPQVVIGLPQLIRNNLSLFGHFHIFVLDEAQEWYFVGRTSGKKSRRKMDGDISKILNVIKPKKSLLLTGSPFEFNSMKSNYDFFYIPAMDLYRKGIIGNVKIEIITSSLDLKYNDYESKFGNVQKDLITTKDQDIEALSTVCKSMLKKLKNPVKDLHTFNRLTNNFLSVFNSLDKTLILCRNTDQANNFYSVINSFPDLNGKVLISHSKNDDDSKYFKMFQENESSKILIAVNRGKIGFNMRDLYNIVDFTYTKNLSILVQMIGRLFRLPTEKSNKQKIYYKVSPRGSSYFYEIIMSAVLSLLERNAYENFNGKNTDKIVVPIFEKRSKRNNKRKIDTEDSKSQISPTRGKQISLEDMGMDMDLDLFKKFAIHRSDDEFSTVSYTTLDDASSAFYGIRERNELSHYKEAVMTRYHKGDMPTIATIHKDTGINTVAIAGIFKIEGVLPWEKKKTEDREILVKEAIEKNPEASPTEMAKSIGMRVAHFTIIANRINKTPWLDKKNSEEEMVIKECQRLRSANEEVTYSKVSMKTGVHLKRTKRIMMKNGLSSDGMKYAYFKNKTNTETI